MSKTAGGHDFATMQARLQRHVDTTDTGSCLPATAAALALADPVERLVALVEALATERVLVAAQVGSAHQAGQPCHQLTQIEDEGGAPVSVAFTSLEAFRRFGAPARPVPLSGSEVASLALASTAGRLWVDPLAIAPRQASSGVRLPRPATVALAQSHPWMPAWEDSALREHLRSYRGEIVAYLRLLPTAGPEVVLRVGVHSRARRSQVEAVLAQLAKDTKLLAAVERLQLQPVIAQLG